MIIPNLRAVKTCALELEDFSNFITPGQPFDLRSRIIQTAEAFVLVYDVTSTASFDSIKSLHAEVRRGSKKTKAGKQRPIAIAGNKCDDRYDREVLPEMGRKLAKDLNCRFAEVSTLEDTGLESLFLGLAIDISNLQRRQEDLTLGESIKKIGKAIISAFVRVSDTMERAHGKILCWMYGPDQPLRHRPGLRYQVVAMERKRGSWNSSSKSRRGHSRKKSSRSVNGNGNGSEAIRHSGSRHERDERESPVQDEHQHVRHREMMMTGGMEISSAG